MYSPDLVSVVIPCHKQAEFLGSAIESVLAQQNCETELIVIDDGSDDSTAEVAKRYEKVRCLRQKKSGVAEARNRGLLESNGEFIVFLDADDRLLPRALEHALNSLRSHPECAFVYGFVHLISSDGTRLPTPPQTMVEQHHYLELLRHNYIWSPGAVMYRKRIFDDETAFNTALGGSADFELNLRIARRFPILCHGHYVLEYRRHGDSMSTDWALMLRDSVNARTLHRRFVEEEPEYKTALERGLRQVRDYYGNRVGACIKQDLENGMWLTATRKLMILARYYPGRIFSAWTRRLAAMTPRTRS